MQGHWSINSLFKLSIGAESYWTGHQGELSNLHLYLSGCSKFELDSERFDDLIGEFLYMVGADE